MAAGAAAMLVLFNRVPWQHRGEKSRQTLNSRIIDVIMTQAARCAIIWLMAKR
ncbi:hypothetical protein AM571_PC01624 (plasmid) [Rhizobium etli 8C-3]|uniref:Uncharacterized protein n=1 Tax=Rhizobium etli 8C-3 TaxID=538025 RepID=A0A1L5PH00_RHIET|nr:hypothetical protein AM571_PC01624 [Rhizobium etli 8C-3]